MGTVNNRRRLGRGIQEKQLPDMHQRFRTISWCILEMPPLWTDLNNCSKHVYNVLLSSNCSVLTTFLCKAPWESNINEVYCCYCLQSLWLLPFCSMSTCNIMNHVSEHEKRPFSTCEHARIRQINWLIKAPLRFAPERVLGSAERCLSSAGVGAVLSGRWNDKQHASFPLITHV